MKTLRNKIGILIILTIGVVTVISCGSNEYKKIPLEDLDPTLKSMGDLIVNDILSSISHEKGARFLLDKDYITPMVHGRILHNLNMYNESYIMIPMVIGEVSNYSLFQVLDKGILNTLRYKIETDSEDMKFIELMVDINNSYGLADYYLYVTSNDGLLQRHNILPVAKK